MASKKNNFHSLEHEKFIQTANTFRLFALFIAISLILSCCAHKPAGCDLALKKVMESNLPLFIDDAKQKNLKTGVEKSLQVLEGKNEQQFYMCNQSYSVARLRQSLSIFLDGMKKASDETAFNNFIIENFDICQAAGADNSGQMLITGYYEPVFSGSLVKSPPYIYPLYRIPPDLIVPDRQPRKEGRLQNGKIIPYWSREKIEKGNLLQGLEIIYLADPVDVFILHVQGSGRIRLPDGSECRVHYAASNGRKYRSIGRLLADRGIIPVKEVTLPKIVSYLHAHPSELQDILNYNERYIFFSLTCTDSGQDNEHGPAGSMGCSLTAGRSLALDNSCFPVPMVGFLETNLPVFTENGILESWKPLHRFVVNQDTGAAIKGPGRVDLFLGSDDYAARAAGVMKQPGTLYFLLLKEEKM